MCLMAAFVPHRPNKYFHVTASNGIVSNSPYTPLAIMTASPIASVRVFDPRCRCRLATLAALPTPSMIERAIIMLTDHRFWGHASGPSSSGKTLPRSIYCWHGHAARRSALPRERFSPLGEERKWLGCAPRSQFVKVCGCRPHDGGAADTGPAYANLQWRKPREVWRGGASDAMGIWWLSGLSTSTTFAIWHELCEWVKTPFAAPVISKSYAL